MKTLLNFSVWRSAAQMAKARSTQQTKTSADAPAAEAVIGGELAGAGLASRLRQISPVTAALVGAVIIALGLSVWPYMAPYVIAPSDDPWQQSVDQELADLRTGLEAVRAQQNRLAETLQTLQASQTQLDQTMADVVQSVSQSVDTVSAAIDRFDQQIAHIKENYSARPPAEDEGAPAAVPAQPDQQDSPADSAPADSAPVQQDSPASGSGLLSELAVPDLSGWWQGLADWVSGLVSFDRIDTEKSDKQ